MPQTYEPISTTTLGSAVTSYTFSSIPSTYTDLVLITSIKNTSAGNRAIYFRLNGDTATNYSYTELNGDGTTASSARSANATFGQIGNASFTNFSTGITNFNNYRNTTTNKTGLARSAEASVGTKETVSLWRSTAAITSIQIYLNADNLAIGSVLTLYGIKAA